MFEKAIEIINKARFNNGWRNDSLLKKLKELYINWLDLIVDPSEVDQNIKKIESEHQELMSEIEALSPDTGLKSYFDSVGNYINHAVKQYEQNN